MAVLTPSGTTGFNIEAWQRKFEFATYQRMKWLKTIDEGDRPLNLLHIRRNARVPGTVLAQSDAGTTLTYSTIAAAAVTATPVGNYVAAAWSKNEGSQVEANLDAEARANIEAALAEATEQSGLTTVATLTQSMSQPEVDGPMWRKASGRLMGNTNGMAGPGETEPVYAVFSHTQLPGLGGIPEFNNAEIRGDDETPYVKGIWMRGGGATLLMSTVVYSDANGWHNVIFVPSAFVVAWNVRSDVSVQDLELQHRVIAYNNVAIGIKNDLRALDMRTTTSGL